MNAFNQQIRGILAIEEHRPEEGVVGVQNLHTSKLVVPTLTIAIESTATSDLDVLASPSPERDGVLEWM